MEGNNRFLPHFENDADLDLLNVKNGIRRLSQATANGLDNALRVAIIDTKSLCHTL